MEFCELPKASKKGETALVVDHHTDEDPEEPKAALDVEAPVAAHADSDSDSCKA